MMVKYEICSICLEDVRRQNSVAVRIAGIGEQFVCCGCAAKIARNHKGRMRGHSDYYQANLYRGAV